MIMKRIELITMELCHTHCVFCNIDCYQQMIFLGECGHSFCVECSIRLYEASQLSPVTFGCPPCPNGCSNPKEGIQCECPEQLHVQSIWKKIEPKQYHQWVAEETLFRYKDGIFRCPVCKKL